MISTIDDALEQNNNLVKECFKLTQKYERSNNEISELRQRIEELEVFLALTRENEKVDNDASLKLIATLKAKEMQIEKGKQEIAELNIKLSKSQELYRPMTQKYVEVSKSNLEQAKEIKMLHEKIDRMKIALSEGENREKKLEEKIAKSQENCPTKEEMNKEKRLEQEIHELKQKVEDRDEKIIALVHRRNHDFANNNLKAQQKEEKLKNAQNQIESLKFKANNWYMAYGALRQEIIELRKQKLTSSSELHNFQLEKVVENLFQENAKLGSSLNEATHKINQFERESKNSGLKNIFYRRSSQNEAGLSDKVLDKLAKMEQELETLKGTFANNSFALGSSSSSFL